MKAVSAALAMFLLAPQQEDDAAKKVQRIDRALGWLSNEDVDVREMGRKDLETIGRDAIPAIESMVAKKGAAELVQLLRHFDQGPGIAEQWVAEQELRDLEADEQFRKEAGKLSKDVAEKYGYVKYQEALAHVRHKNYQRGFDLASALITLETRSAHLDAFKRLRRHCETMITQTTLIEAKVLQPKVWYAEGETVELSVRMKNIYRAPMTLSWDKSTAPESGGGMLVLEVEVTMNEMGGSSSSDQRHQDLRFEDEVSIAPGAQWERKFVLDTSTAIPDDRQIRVVKVGGWTQPTKVSTDGVNITRRLQFEPALVKIIPKAYARFLDNPLEWLDKMITDGSPREVYVCSQLLEGDDKDRGAEKLIRLLEKSETTRGQVYVVNILTSLTGQALGADARRWQNWLKTKASDKDSKDKKKK